IEGAILSGDRETGVTIMRVIEQMDAGAMLHRRVITIADDETTGTLKRKLAEVGAEALLEALEKFRSGEIIGTPQDESLATYTKIITKADAIIDWHQSAVQIERMARAYDPWPVARTSFGGSDLMIYRARVIASEIDAEAGSIVSIGANPVVKCGDGALELLEVQAPGRLHLEELERMRAGDWARGRHIAVGNKLGA
ncbi:MAG TPA: methionyl-tRNA formyltransferase, partial [Candidatus Binataceae bacterium]|nr:methionyl-tRNA formyltransferase [Candidatus Binataceae bacterium]